jgi:universal stress protein A
MRTIKTILYATDLNELAQNAFATAYGLAQEHDARLILLHVKEPQEVVEGEFGMIPPEPEPSDEEILAQLESLLPEYSAGRAECMVVHGNAGEEIVRVATDSHCDLIVLGTHSGKGFLTRLFHVSVADQVAESAPCPVMCLEAKNQPAAVSS